MVKRSEQDQNEEEIDEEDMDDSMGERVEEARALLERLEENRRESKDGRTEIFQFSVFNRIFSSIFQVVWTTNF